MSVSEDPSVADEWEPSSRTSLALGAYIVVIFAAATWLLFCLWPEAESSRGGPHAGAELRLLAIVAVMGALGANIFTMSSYCLHLARRDFDRSYVSWYLLRPAIGAGMAMIVYMLVRGGMLMPNISTKDINIHGIAGVSGLCGLVSQRAYYKLREVFTTLFRTREDEKEDEEEKATG